MKLKSRFIYTIFSITVLGIILFSTKSYAGVSVSNTKVESGGTASISITSSEAVASFKVELTDNGGLTFKSANSSFATSNVNGTSINGVLTNGSSTKLATYTFTVPTVTEQKTYIVKFKASGMANENGDSISGSTAQATVTVTPKAKATEPNFTAVNQTVYAKNETNVRESYSTSSKSYGLLPAGESVTRIGLGDNGWSKVTYNGKTAYIYSNNLTTTKPEETKSIDKALKTLNVTEGTLEPEFNPETTKYSVTVPNNVEQAKIEAIANSEKATVAITGNEKLVAGSNLVKITVTAEDGTTRIYNLEVIKTNQDPAQLVKLEIPGITLEPAFSPEVYQYKIQLDPNSTVTDFNIQAQANLEDATVEIIGNSNFKEGENVVTILVTSADGTEKSSYQIIVNKPATSSEGIFAGNNGKTNIALIAIGVLVVVAIIIVVITIIKKRRDEEDFDDDEVDPYKPSFNDDDLDTEEDAKKEDFTGIYKQHIMDDDEMEAKQTMQQTGRFQTQNMSVEPQSDDQEDGEDYIPDTKQEKNIDNTMEMTRRYSTNYDYTLEQQYKKTKNTGKGKHF